jgi:hypothetical protein
LFNDGPLLAFDADGDRAYMLEREDGKWLVVSYAKLQVIA